MDKTSIDLQNIHAPGRPAGWRLLTLLKTRGPQTAADLGKALGITAEAARQQLVKLAGDGLVTATAEVRGVGRPVQLWHLTDAGDARFPDTHAELTVALIQAVRSELGESSLERLISARQREIQAAYHRELAGITTLARRVEELAAVRSREGYMAEWWTEDSGFVLAENHCPICAAATVCQGFCAGELELFRDVLGPDVRVDRVEHILGGARRCVYRITPDEDDTPSL
ncbi:MAG: metalloregulator ArsR/SmtB family transcription factor [Chloroflexota bacterium]